MQVDLFAGLERITLAKLAAYLEPRSYKSHEIIFRQAEPGDAFYLVASGSVGVYLVDESGATEIRVRVLHAGEAAAPLITIAIAPVASAAGVHPFVVGLIAVFLPYQSTAYLALYTGTGGKLFTHTQALPTALAYGVWTIVAVALSVPVWRLMGLL